MNTNKMTKKEVLKHLDKLVQSLRLKPQWTREEVIAMQVQTFRTYRIIAQKHGIHESTVKRICEKIINQNNLLSSLSS